MEGVYGELVWSCSEDRRFEEKKMTINKWRAIIDKHPKNEAKRYYREKINHI